MSEQLDLKGKLWRKENNFEKQMLEHLNGSFTREDNFTSNEIFLDRNAKIFLGTKGNVHNLLHIVPKKNYLKERSVSMSYQWNVAFFLPRIGTWQIRAIILTSYHAKIFLRHSYSMVL